MQQIQSNPGGNFLAGLTGGMQAGQNIRQANDQNALRNIFATQNINDPAVQQKIMGLDPQAGMALQDRAYQREQDTYQRGRQEVADSRAEQTFQMNIRQAAAQMSDAERQQEAAKIERGMMPAIQFFEQGNLPGFNSVLEAAGEQPIASLDQAPAVLRKYKSVFDALVDVKEFNAGPDAQSPEGKRAADAKAGLLDLNVPQVDFETEQKFRKEFLGIPAVKAFSEQAQAYDRIINSATDPSPAGDLALIFNFMKVLDPGSVVRESEFETAAQATAWLQQSEELGINVPQPVAGAIRKMASGQRLAPAQRDDFVGRAGNLYDGAERGFMNIKSQYEQKAEDYNLDPQRSLMDFRRPSDAPQPAAPVQRGDVPASQLSDEDLLRLYGVE